MFENIFKFLTLRDGKKELIEVPDYHSGVTLVPAGKTFKIQANKQSTTHGNLLIEETGCVDIEGDLIIT